MKVYINELSLVGQAADNDEAMGILFNLASAVAKTRGISFEQKAYRSRTLGDKLVTGEATVRDVLFSSSNKALIKDERQRKFILEVLLKKPYSESNHVDQKDSITNASGSCLKDTCFDGAASSVGSPLTVSAQNCHSYQLASTQIYSSIWGEKRVLNVTDESGLSEIVWIFEHNPKHRTAAYSASGESVSAMDLCESDAQSALSNGIMVDSRVYSYFNGEWYQFHCHQGNKFHGFKIDLEKNNVEHMKALNISESLMNLPYGQIFL
ncbi:hypothetical protein [Pseudomonas silesiensis]|uniref:hypothetical protein n=1 Tax=Pseudomonas silesiensis TaxID=1853130 RepID=UPI0030DB82A6